MSIDFAERWHEIEPLLDQLFDVPVGERSDWLRRHSTDARLQALVEQALEQASGIEQIEQDIAQQLPACIENLPDTLPSVAGYRILRFVGAGGMASVFEAMRELPGGAQTVALKLLRINVHDPDERRRFLREQYILARLQHPHIAQLLDAGFTPTGTPFLSLEFVVGDNLIVHCERHGLGTRDRLALFIDVCAAVEHAHRNLIVHRDLKPGNVLVSADGCVKLVDFGIAKLLTGEGDETRTEARRLTRVYAAPEQFTGGVVTTAIDVYALGVLLAELLGGGRPRRTHEHGIDAREVDRGTADAHVFDHAALRRKLGADLHAIVREATQSDPVRRYTTVAALREDIELHLESKPLRAHANTFAYRTRTFVKRHALAVTTGTACAVILAAAAIVSLHEAKLAQRAAGNAQRQAMIAEAQAQRADAVKSFLEGLFDSASPGLKSSQTAEELLARGHERADRDFAMQPALRVEILALIGDLERRSGRPDLAQQPLEEAAKLAKTQFGPTDRRTLHVEYLIAKEADELGHVHDATARLQRAVDAFGAGPDHGSPEQVQAFAWLAGLDERSGESAKAIDLGDKALAIARATQPKDSEALTEAVLNLGWILLDAGHADRAEPLLREALARQRSQFGTRHAEVADTMSFLGWALIRLGRYGESERLMREVVDIDASVYTHPHPHLARHLNDLANVLSLEGKLDEANAFYLKSMAVDKALEPAAELDAAIILENLARIRFRQGAYAEAESDMRSAIEREQNLLGKDYGDNGRSYDEASLAKVLIARGRFDEARALVDSALSEARQRHHDAHPDTAFALTVEATLMAALGNRENAAMYAKEAVATYSALADQSSDKAIRARLEFGEILLSLHRDTEAKPQLENALKAAEGIEPRAAVLVVQASADLARADEALGDRADASRLRNEARSSFAEIPSAQGTERDAAMRLVAGVSADARR